MRVSSAPAHNVVRKEGAWGLWWLVVVTFGVYYYIWYQRINRELTTITGEPRDASCEWWSQLIPIYNLVALAQTASRVNKAHEVMDSPTRVSSFVTWFWAPSWFASQTRYLQRRINILHDVQVSQQRRAYESASDGQTGTPDVTKQLARLGKLRDTGVLTDEEFAAKKAELLGH